MPFPEGLVGDAEARHVEPDVPDDITESEADEELSDADLEDVLGGLERIHFPVIDVPELDR